MGLIWATAFGMATRWFSFLIWWRFNHDGLCDFSVRMEIEDVVMELQRNLGVILLKLNQIIGLSLHAIELV